MRSSLWAALLLVAGCGLSPLGLLTGGGGPSATAIGTQIGKENTQQLVANQERIEAGRDVVTTTKEVEAGQIEKMTVNNQDIPVWVIVALVVGWILPSPTEMARSIINTFRRPKPWASSSERSRSTNSKASTPTSSKSSPRPSKPPPLTSRSSVA